MTGLYDGTGIAIMLAMIFFIVTPLVTTAIIKELGIFNHLNGMIKKVLIGLTFLLLMTLTLLIIRANPYGSLDGLLVYNLILLVVLIINRIKKNKKPAANNG